MNPSLIFAGLCGVVLGSGLWLTVVRLPFLRGLTFTERVAPQLRSQDTSSRLLRIAAQPLTPFGPLERILAPAVRDVVARLGRIRWGNSALQERLVRAGSSMSPLDFRAGQLLLGGAAFTAVLLLSLVGLFSGGVTPGQAVLAALSAAALVSSGRNNG